MRAEHGFSLIEVVATLVLIGLLALLGGMFLIDGVSSYVFSTANSKAAMKGQNAMERIASEIREITAVKAFTEDSSIHYVLRSSAHPTLGGKERKLVLNGDELSFVNVTDKYTSTLIDDVQGFSLSMHMEDIDDDGVSDDINSIAVSIDLGNDRTFSTQVYPRELVSYP
ncbi:MAG: prepilin-type N-terminal cleavage/methylation domain-containing protein [Desulfovibrionales bacterium]